jgi:ADP-ribosyl-[dinitrogen reductase] hydrolase
MKLTHPMKQNAAAGLWGLLLGDALGVPYEFTSPDELPDLSCPDMQPPEEFDRAHASTLPGTWSDDGSQALVLLHHLQEHGGFNADTFAHDLLRWRKGWLWVDDTVFDVGLQTERVLRRLAQGLTVEQATEAHEHSNGNGSLMRVLPLALWHEGSDAELVHVAHAQSRVTHAHAQSLVSCALYVLVARGLLNEGAAAALPRSGDMVAQPSLTLRTVYENWAGPERGTLLATLDWICAWPREHHPAGKGYVVDSLWSCLSTLKANSFREAIRQAIAFGNDTDTTAALAGGLAGLRFGMPGLPSDWLQDLRGKELAEPLILRQWGTTPEI